MNLRTKTFFIILAVGIIVSLAMSLFLGDLIRKNTLRDEAQITKDKIEQFNAQINAQQQELTSLTKDWAEWDDSYRYLLDRNPKFIQSNFVSGTYFNNNLDFAAIYDIKGGLVYSQYFAKVPGDTPDVIYLEPAETPQELLAYLGNSSPFIFRNDATTGIQGIITLPYAPMFMVSNPILNSDGSGPSRGTLIFGRCLDQILIQGLPGIGNLKPQVFKVNDPALPADLHAEFSKENTIVVRAINDQIISGYLLISDINGQPSLIIKIETSRGLYSQANNDVTYYSLSLIVFVLLFIVAILWILERMVISRVTLLSNRVNIIGRKGDLTARVISSGKDEISRLAGNINGMLENLEQSRKQQKESETFNLTLLNDSPTAIEVLNPDGSIRYVNPALEILTGYTQAQIIGRKPPFPWWPTENIQKYYPEFSVSLEHGALKYERKFLKPDNTPFWVELTSTAIKQNGKTQFLIFNWVDITERKRAEDALRESEEFSSSLRDNSPFPIMVINPDTSIRYVNPALEKLSGFSTTELVGQKTPYPFFREDHQEQHAEIFPVQMQSIHSLEALFRKKSGETFYVDITSTPIMEDSHPKYLLAMWVDVTAQKATNEQLEQLYQREKGVREDLQVEIKSRIEFTRALVHELKTPLTPIMASSELLIEELTEEPLLGLAKNVYRGAENMNRRVDELLDMARSEVGILKVNLNPIDPEKLLREAFKYMEPSAKSGGQTLVLDLPANLPVIIADDDRVRQIIFNLISNSIKYSSKNGEIKISAFEKGNELVIEIKDQGLGMTKEEQEKLFQPYYRIEGHERLSGLGLGLALSKRLVELQNGSIWAKSQKGQGSTFSFALPIRREIPNGNITKSGGAE
jgi:PAS domain S-box-containing protein